MAYVEMNTSWDYVGLTLIPILDNGELDTDKKAYLPDMGLYRVSNSNRYEDNLVPTLKHTTVEVPGGDGMYWFGSQHTQRQFTVNFAYDNLTAENLTKLRSLLDGKKHLMLVFDEWPYKYYDVIINTAPQFKYVPFSEERTATDWGGDPYLEDVRYFKGEATINFVCYDPYARGTCLNLEASRLGDLEPCSDLPNYREVVAETRILTHPTIDDGGATLTPLNLNTWISNFDADAANMTGIALVNCGDIALDLRIELTKSIYENLKKLKLETFYIESGHYYSNRDAVYFKLNDEKTTPDGSVVIDSRLHLIYDSKNNFLNRDIESGDFFKIEPSTNCHTLYDSGNDYYARTLEPIYLITPLDASGNVIDGSMGKMSISYSYKFF